MNNQQIREEFRKLVIMGCHPDCQTYDEALEKELGVGCSLKITWDNKHDFPDLSFICDEFIMSNDKIDGLGLNSKIMAIPKDQNKPYLTVLLIKHLQIIGQPITIGRVMSVLKGRYAIESNGSIVELWECEETFDCNISHISDWKLTHNNREATADDQDIETIKDLMEVVR